MDYLISINSYFQQLLAPATIALLVRFTSFKTKQNLEKVYDSIVKSEIENIRSSKGNSIPSLYTIGIRLKAKINSSKNLQRSYLEIGNILIMMFNQISDLPSFPKKQEVLEKLKLLIIEWFDNTPPPRTFFKWIKLKRKKLTVKQVQLLQPNTKSNKFLGQLTNVNIDTPGHVDFIIEVEKSFRHGVIVSGPIPLSIFDLKSSENAKIKNSIEDIIYKGFQGVVKRYKDFFSLIIKNPNIILKTSY